MSIIRWDPFRDLNHLRNEMDRVFDHWRNTSANTHPRDNFVPRIDLYQTENDIVATVDLPGLESKEDVEVAVTENSLSIQGQVVKTSDVKQENYYHTERFTGTFTRTVPLPAEVEADKTTAHYRNGILEVRMPKSENQKRKKVQIDIN
ncbi:MAG: Hsp20/alpha crystallin family protein [Bacillota bacterium]